MSEARFDVIVERLTEIRDLLVVQVQCMTAMPEEPAPGPCLHPEDVRINLTGFGGPPEWVCKACGFRTNGLSIGE